MPPQKRQTQRQRDSRQARQAAQQAARRRKEQRRRLGVAIVCAAVLILGVSAFVATGGSSKKVETAAPTTTAAVQRTPVSLSPVPAGATVTGDTACPKTDGTAQRTTAFAKPPPRCIDPNKGYAAEVRTTRGNFIITLDPRAAPNTVNNFVVLARYKFFEGIPFHRIIPGFVVQVGDPQATGRGGPGYQFDDELPRQGAYKIGSVAMANSGPNTNGSQFFIITGDAGVILPPRYSLFGTVTEGMDAVKSIESVGTPEGPPTEAVIIQSISIRES